MGPDFTNDNSVNVLNSQTPAVASEWWWFLVIAPPVAWFCTVIVRHRAKIGSWLPSFRSARTRCLAAIDAAGQASEIAAALTHFVADRTRRACSSPEAAVGVLRLAGITQVANDVEAFLVRCEAASWGGSSETSLDDVRQESREFLERMNTALDSVSKSLVRRAGRGEPGQAAKIRSLSNSARRASLWIFVVVVGSSCGIVSATEPSAVHTGIPRAEQVRQQSAGINTLSLVQQQIVLTEAGDLYARATDAAKSDSAEANDLFMASAAKYQLLADAGVQNAHLWRNLGNACLQSNQLGRAIANYERARRMDPSDRQLAVNLEFANSLVKGQESISDSESRQTAGAATSLQSMARKLRALNAMLIGMAGLSTIVWTLVMSSLLFWSLAIARAAGYRFPLWRFAMVPLLLLATSLSSAILASTPPRDQENGVIVAGKITLHAGDGELFETVYSCDVAQGHRVQILTSRGDWTQVKTHHGLLGWLPSRDVESISL